jgi:hypothetical protein
MESRNSHRPRFVEWSLCLCARASENGWGSRRSLWLRAPRPRKGMAVGTPNRLAGGVFAFVAGSGGVRTNAAVRAFLTRAYNANSRQFARTGTEHCCALRSRRTSRRCSRGPLWLQAPRPRRYSVCTTCGEHTLLCVECFKADAAAMSAEVAKPEASSFTGC